jgi:hypothetical protein
MPPAALFASCTGRSKNSTKDDGVVAWGCGGRADAGQCRVPASARSGVTAIAAGGSHSLALKPGS